MTQTLTKENRSKIYVPIIISLVILFNPSISVIDFLPDFIAYFILAHVFLRASDRAPYFEEARVAFRRLAWLNLIKLPGLFAMIFVKGENFSDNDIIPLITLVFAVCEAILTCLAVKNLFSALFYLGQRTDASATVKPFSVFGKVKILPEKLCAFTYFFSVARCVLYFFPTVFLLTRGNSSNTGTVRISKLFPIILIASVLLGFLIGFIWLIITAKYAKALRREEKFELAIESLASKSTGIDFDAKEKLRKIKFALSLFVIATFFTLELTLVESYDVNLLPRFIYAAIMLLAVYSLSRYSGGARLAYISGAAYFVSATVAYVFETKFLIDYGYEKLVSNKAAKAAYLPVNITAIIEFLCLVFFLYAVFAMFVSFASKNTRISGSKINLRGDYAYYGNLKLKSLIVFISGSLAGLVRLISVFAHGASKLVYTDKNDITQPVIIAPSIEWIGLAVAVLAIVYIGCTIYFVSTLKDEVNLKYEQVDTRISAD